MLKEYKEKYDDYMQKAAELDDITKQRDDAKSSCDEMSKQRLDDFMAGFTKISLKLKEMYQVNTLTVNG